MGNPYLWGIGAFIAFCGLTVWALCRAAAAGDKAIAEAFERNRSEK